MQFLSLRCYFLYLNIIWTLTPGISDAIFAFHPEIQDGRQKWSEDDFGEKSPVDSAYTLWVQNFVEVALSGPVSEINAFLCLTQKFKIAAKSGWKTIFAKSHQLILYIPCGSKISSKSLYLAPFLR